MNFITNAIESIGDQTVPEVKFQRGIYGGGSFSTLVFIISIIPLHSVLRKRIGSYILTKSKEMINHLIYIDYIKLFAKYEKKEKKKKEIDTNVAQSARVVEPTASLQRSNTLQ